MQFQFHAFHFVAAAAVTRLAAESHLPPAFLVLAACGLSFTLVAKVILAAAWLSKSSCIRAADALAKTASAMAGVAVIALPAPNGAGLRLGALCVLWAAAFGSLAWVILLLTRPADPASTAGRL